jgi:hypothetical protein
VIHKDASAALVPRNDRREAATERDGVPQGFQFSSDGQKVCSIAGFIQNARSPS